jgi:hypothetical protein
MFTMARKDKLRFDGMGLPKFSPLIADAQRRFTDIENLPMRNDDVIISGFPKSGKSCIKLTCYIHVK